MPLHGENMGVLGMFHRFNESVAGYGGRDEVGRERPDALVVLCGHHFATRSQNFSQSGAWNDFDGMQSVFLAFVIHVVAVLGGMNVLVKASSLQDIDELHAIADS